MRTTSTLGRVIAERRSTIGLSLKDLACLVHKEGGNSVSPQYIFDIEKDRRTPSRHVMGELASALGVDANYLVAVAGQAPTSVTAYLQANPEQAAAVAAAFERAAKGITVDWNDVAMV